MRSPFPPEVERGRIRDGHQRSEPGEPFGAFSVVVRVGDARTRLTVIASDGLGWDHVSVSTPTRCPRWEEMAAIKDLFFGPDEAVMQLHPADRNYINNHPFCLHLWRPQNVVIPMPPLVAV